MNKDTKISLALTRVQFNWTERILELGILLISATTSVAILMIFVFVGRESMPVIFGKSQLDASQLIRSVEDLDKMSAKEIMTYLGLSKEEYNSLDKQSLRELMLLKIETARDASKDKDAFINAASLKYLFFPHQWTGYDKPVFIWQPVSEIRKFNIIPLIVGSLKISLIAILVSVPFAIASAILVSVLVHPKIKEVLKPLIELLAGIPSVVIGVFGLIVIANIVQSVTGCVFRLNSLTAGIALSFAVIPVIFSICEDALSSVPKSYIEAAYALGASRWKMAFQVVMPAAFPGVFAALMIGFGRAFGETMIVLMASGNASILSASILDPARTITATIAAELAETVFGDPHYSVLFFIGLLLFIFTFILNIAANLVMGHLRTRIEGKK